MVHMAKRPRMINSFESISCERTSVAMMLLVFKVPCHTNKVVHKMIGALMIAYAEN